MSAEVVVRAIDTAAHAKYAELPRQHLGASVMGYECMRKVWYEFRWALPKDFSGRMLRLFQRGRDEEARFVALLRNAGVTVVAVDPSTGKQYRHIGIGGHMGGSLDGVLKNVLTRAINEELLGEFKTHNFDSFKALKEDGVRKSKPEHYAQMQLYMRWHKLNCALYLAVCKDDDELYAEFVDYNEEFAADAEARGTSVIKSETTPYRLSNDPTFFKCAMCDFRPVCHFKQWPKKSCRTCAHATPEIDEGAQTGRWSCAYWKQPSIPVEFQHKGCDHHVFNPAFVQNIGEYRGGDTDLNYAEYVTKAGVTFRNGTKRADPLVYASDEIPFANLLPTPTERALVEEFNAKYVEPAVTTQIDDAVNAEIRANFEAAQAAKKLAKEAERAALLAKPKRGKK